MNATPIGRLTLVIGSILAASAARVAAEVPDYDFEWAIIGDPSNPPWPGGMYGQTAGRGSVDYVYRMSVLEVSSAQWLEFINIFAPQSDDPANFLRPSTSGLRPVTGQPGVYILNPFSPNAADLPVLGITWRDAAMYVNWLNNGKSTEWEAIQSGAYETSTFTQNPPTDFTGTTYNDQLTHDPEARFWLPTLDEWMKAAHWDPNKYGEGEGEGGWWEYPGMSDAPLTPGQPGEGQTSADLSGAQAPHSIPLGAYPESASPWGLLDTSGGAAEWTEEPIGEKGLIARVLGGAWAGSGTFALEFFDSVDTLNALRPDFPVTGGLRIASRADFPAPDLNGDGLINGADLATLLATWGPCAEASLCAADLNRDGFVDVDDLVALLRAWKVFIDE